jgi:uncharacterized RDD family membrane protein YckC
MPAVVSLVPAPLWRRLAAAVYDLLPLVGIWMGGAFVALLFVPGHQVPPGTTWFQLYLAALTAAYFGLSWIRGGQTIGMRAWKIRLVGEDGQPASPAMVAGRLLLLPLSLLPLGAGVIAAAFDPAGRMWHDRGAGTRVVRVNPA